ncbi:MAG: alanine dehydrogenase [Bdellovibrionota bacterium]|nr:MAG: alanine dehydrogenase [Bdellovibrionota bacterium]
MIIGVPRERKTLEKRVAVTPDGVRELRKHNHTVLVETNAGVGSHFSDDAFREAGATIVDTLKDVWTKSEIVVKVKEPHESEYEYFRPGLVLFDYLHLASMPDVTDALLKGGVTGIAYELVQISDGRLPLLEPMSEVAGRLSVVNGSNHLLSQHGGRGMLLGGTVTVPPARVVIVGAGVAGRNACDVAIGMGADVTILDTNYLRLDRIKAQYGHRVCTMHSTRAALERAINGSDLLIGAVLIPGAAAPKVITRTMIQSMNRGGVFVDISIDQGGCAETIRATSLDNPVYEEEGVVHYGVCNMPAQVPCTSTMALTAATLPYLIALADGGGIAALQSSTELRNALNTHKGKLTNAAVSEAVGIAYTPIEKALAA